MILKLPTSLENTFYEIKQNYIIEFNGEEYLPEYLMDSFFGQECETVKSVIDSAGIKPEIIDNQMPCYNLSDIFNEFFEFKVQLEEYLSCLDNICYRFKILCYTHNDLTYDYDF